MTGSAPNVSFQSISWWTKTQNEFPCLVPCVAKEVFSGTSEDLFIAHRLCESQTKERCFYNSSKFELFPWSSFIIHFVSWLNSIPPTHTLKPLTSGLCHIFQWLWSLKGHSIWTFSQLWGNDGKKRSVHSGLSICKAEEPSCTRKAFRPAKVCQDGRWQQIFVGYRPRQSPREQHRRLPLVQSLVTIR